MTHLAGKKILLGVCGSIAAYKSVVLARWFMKQGAEVKVVLTNAAKDFVTPLTYSTLTKNEVLSEISSDKAGIIMSNSDFGQMPLLLLP